MNIKEVGARLRQARERAGLTQKQLANKLHQSASSVTHWEAGNKNIPVNKLIEVAKLLNVSPAWLIDPRGCSPSPTEKHIELVKKTIVVLDSNTHYADTLTQNIESFHAAVVAEKTFEERLSALETTIHRLGAPPPAGPTSGNAINSQRGKNLPLSETPKTTRK